MPGSTPYLVRIDDFEKFPSMPALVVLALRRIVGSVPKARFEVILGNLFDIRISGDSVTSEALAIESGKSFDVRYKPRLHGLSHELAMIVMRVFITPLPAGL